MGSLLLASTLAAAQFRTITVQNAPSNPVPANINANGTPTVNVGNMPAVSGSVTVNNAEANPVPVSGSVNAAITGSVGITGTPVVNAQSPNAPATVINSQAITPVVVRDMDERARHPFQHQFFCGTSPGSTSFCGDSFSVPAGKELVIEYLEMRASESGGNNMDYLTLGTTTGGTTQTHYYPPGTLISPTLGRLNHEIVRLYADPGTSITLSGVATSTTGAVGFVVGVSGYLIDLP